MSMQSAINSLSTSQRIAALKKDRMKYRDMGKSVYRRYLETLKGLEEMARSEGRALDRDEQEYRHTSAREREERWG